MAEGFEPFHVPQQSRRDKLRVLQNNTTCEDAAVVAAATFQGCSGLLPLYDPSLLFNGAHGFHNQNNNPLDGEAVESCKENQTCAVKEEGVNLMGYVGGGFMNPSTSSSSHHPYLDPHSSLVMNPTSIQDINNNPFFYTTQNLRGDFDQPFNGGGEVVTFKPESLSLTRDSTTTGQGLSLSLSSQHTHHNNHPLELNLQRYGYAMFGDKGIGDYAIRGSTSNDVSRSSVPLGPFTGYASILKGSRFLKPAHQLLEELCDIGQGIYGERSCGNSNLMDPPAESLSGSGIVDDSLACTGDLGEHRRKKTRLISMLDEVYRRYKQYYQQMQAVVASFESVAGLGNAAPYTSFALNAMSKHFRSLKNAITDQLWFTSKALGEGSFEKDEAPRFGTTDPSLYHQKPLHNSHILEHQHVWRPQRGLPERAVAVLRAWLFEHFLHPYPTDTDKQMLAKQTGLSRSQVSNWFINARVRLWKPMVEEIHMLETRQAQKALEPESRNESSDNPSSAKPLSSDKPHQTIPTQKTQDPPSKRSRNEPPTTNFSYNLSSHHHVGIGTNTTGGNHGVSLTLGLRQNNGIGLSEPFPMNIAHRFGLEANNEGYVMGGDFEAQNRQLLHDFVG